MSSNIKHEAVFPPAVYSLRRMTNQSQPRNGSKGSFEMYDPQQTVFGEKRINGIGGSAPGSPGSVHDYKQMVVNLQRELEESKRKGSELQQIITDLNNPSMQPNVGLGDNQFSEASSSNESLGESVKDAHIKHLQRQVTILQANLYKYEGWASRVTDSIKERDRAVDDVTRLTNQIKNLEGDNQQLQQRIETLSTALHETQQNLRQVNEELQGQAYNGQLVTHLRDEVQRQKSEITTLKQSLTQLDQENKSLKDLGMEVSRHSGGNMACSQELEHLHLVVDKLKSIVLEQRAYLLQLKKPNISRNAKSASTSSAAFSGSLLNQEFTFGRKLSSPTLRSESAGSDFALGINPQQAGFVLHNQISGMKSAFMKNKSLQMNVSSADVKQDGEADTRRKLSSRDALDDVFNLEDLNPPPPERTQGERILDMESRPDPRMDGSAYQVGNTRQKSPEFLVQHASGDVGEKNIGQIKLTSADGLAPTKLPQHRTSQSEVMAYRGGMAKVCQENWGSKSEIIGRQALQRNTNNRSPTLAYKQASNEVEKYGQVGPGLALDQGQRYLPAKPWQQESDEVVPSSNTVEGHRQFLLNGSAMQMMLDSSPAVQYENVNRHSPTFQPQKIYHPPSNSQQGSVHASNLDMIVGEKQTISRPPALCSTSHRPAQDVVYVNTTLSQAPSTFTSSSVETDPLRTRLNSDKLCPVCSHDYSHVSMEEFQTHVFECFDDENPPETMKPQVSPNRSCPMCNARFGPETTQSEFEKHVHGHFGEDCIGDNFEILQP